MAVFATKSIAARLWTTQFPLYDSSARGEGRPLYGQALSSVTRPAADPYPAGCLVVRLSEFQTRFL